VTGPPSDAEQREDILLELKRLGLSYDELAGLARAGLCTVDEQQVWQLIQDAARR
jgi:hypothetical protein